MTTKEISNIILSDISENAIDNGHGILHDNVDKYLVAPIQKQFVDSWTDELVTKWLVLDEMPGDLDKGYQIVFDENTKYFGLATKGSKNSDIVGTFIGNYGTFIETLNAM
jgi:hypothetical protein